MVVYEAINRGHYVKVAQFLASQPKDSFWVQCFRGVITQNTADFIVSLKQQRPGFHILVCEDSTKKVRAISVFETRGENPKEPKILTNYLPFWDETDRQNKEYQYVKELIVWSAKYVAFNNYDFAEGIIAERDFSLINAFPVNFKIVREVEVKDPPLGKVRFYRFYPAGVQQ